MVDSQKLLKLVKKNPCLYDTDHPQYLSTVNKRQVWVAIAKEMGLPGQVCKTRWNNMRDSYRKSLYKKSKGLKKYRCKGRYCNEMEFLIKFLKPTVSLSKQPLAEDSDEVSNEEKDDKEKQSGIDDTITDDYENAHKLCKTEEVDVEDTHEIEERLDQEDEEDYPSIEFAHLYDIKEKGRDVNPFTSVEHPVDAFLAGIAPTLKSLSPYHLGLAKMEIFQAIHKYEMKSLAPRRSSKIKMKEQPTSSVFVDDESD